VSDLNASIAELWQRFAPVMRRRLAALDEAAMAAIENRLDESTRRTAEGEAHKLAGSLGTFGAPHGSEAAREAELMLEGSAPLTTAQVLRLSELVERLRAEIDHPPAPRVEEAGAADDRPAIVVVDPDASFTERLVMDGAARGLRVTAVPDVAAGRQAIAERAPDLVVLSMGPDSQDAHALLVDLTARTPLVPVVVVAAGGGFVDRVEVARLGGRGFLQTPVPPAEVLDMAGQVLARVLAAAPKVMAVDDDPQILAVLRALLEPRGVRVTTLDDPQRFWIVLEESAPDLLILDVNLPGISGIELCRVVRADPRWQALPVLFLTAYADPETVHGVFAAGADDFLTKPVIGPDVTARIFNRLERVRLQQRLAETDTLTGLANRGKSAVGLQQLLRLADRYHLPLSLALIDLDNLKSINDTHGHAAGDAVLRRLGQLLAKSFRGEDVVGRWGGEEFAVGMYGMNAHDGRDRIAAVLEAFREPFATDDGLPLRPGFSAGVAEYPKDGETVQDLYRAADQALYRAKDGGKGQVAAAGVAAPETETEHVEVLLVDDDETLAGLLLHALRTRGYRCRWVSDGLTAAQMLTGDPPAVRARVILLDVGLPGLDGLALLRQLAQQGSTAHTRVIMLTARAGEQEIVEALEGGAFDHVSKPFSVSVLMHRIRRALEA
jgi:diguanylate cyclase (GGDEF)-like protein